MKKDKYLKYGLKRVERIELSEKHTRARLIAVIAAIAVAVGALAYAVSGLFAVDTGWQVIESDDSAGVNCAADFIICADIGSHSGSAVAEKRALTTLYTEAAAYAYRLFSAGIEFDGLYNLRYINAHPNEDITVPASLYTALMAACYGGGRYLYLGPVYELYYSLFASADDSEAANYDPLMDAELSRFCADAAGYARDPAKIELRLLGDNVVRLYVSEEYSAFAAENGVTAFIDFGWMKNAFIADYMAEAFESSGYNHITVTSRDGFTRALDARGTSFSAALYGMRHDGTLFTEGIEYISPCAVVTLRAFPLNGGDYYTYADGEIRTPYADVRDGLSRCSASSLTALSGDMSCGEVCVTLAPYFVSDEAFGAASAAELNAQGLSVIWFDGAQFVYAPQ